MPSPFGDSDDPNTFLKIVPSILVWLFQRTCLRRLGLLFWIVCKHGGASYRARGSSPSVGLSAEGWTNLSLRGWGVGGCNGLGGVSFSSLAVSPLLGMYPPEGEAGAEPSGGCIPRTRQTESRHQDPCGSFYNTTMSIKQPRL